MKEDVRDSLIEHLKKKCDKLELQMQRQTEAMIRLLSIARRNSNCYSAGMRALCKKIKEEASRLDKAEQAGEAGKED